LRKNKELTKENEEVKDALGRHKVEASLQVGETFVDKETGLVIHLMDIFKGRHSGTNYAEVFFGRPELQHPKFFQVALLDQGMFGWGTRRMSLIVTGVNETEIRFAISDIGPWVACRR
jgi:hypothetical protein